MTLVAALQGAVATEQAVVYGYGLLTARLTGRSRAAGLAALAAHQLRRDRLGGMLQRLGTPAPAASPAYAAPFPVTDASSASLLAVRLEDSSAGAAWDLVAASGSGTAARRLAVHWLGDAGARAAQWRGPSVDSPALPGQPR